MISSMFRNCLLLALVVFCAACRETPGDWRWNEKRLELEIARTPQERARGLQGHAPLAGDKGMLFVYDEAATRNFWMQGVAFDIDLAYFDDSGKVVSIHRLLAGNPVPVRSPAPARYVLEMRAGWFEQNGIRPGDVWEALAPEPQP